jgi:transcriptional regulator with XRE-family HTH domain
LRETLHLPLRKIAAEYAIDTSTLGKIEQNKRIVNEQIIERLSFILKIDKEEQKVRYLIDMISYQLKEARY